MAAKYIDINKALVDRCISGDSRAQYELYHLYAKQMYNVCLRIVNHQGEAEDVLQDAFLHAFSNMAKFRGECSIGAWLKRIVVNRAINQLRKKRLAPFEEMPGEETPDENNQASDDAQNWNVQQVYKAISELPAGYRVVLCLYTLEGYDHSEIAQILNISESTSKTQYNRARNKVRAMLKVKNYERQV